jgi:hypothetical protein
MQFCVTGEELRKALADIEIAERNGFPYSLAVFDVRVASSMLCDARGYHREGDVWAKAHPTSGRLDWGRQGAHRSHRCVNGKLLPLARGVAMGKAIY